MINRRRFLNNSLLVAGVPLLGNARATADSGDVTDVDKEHFYLPNNMMPKVFETWYISHRGVHLKQRVAGENTIESLRLAKRVGFQCVEFDVWFTKDGKPVVIHDATINRTLRDLNGNKLSEPIYVKDLTFEQIRSDYVVYSHNAKAKTIVPSFEEYVTACSLYKVIPFVELKQHELSKAQYDYLLDYLDKVIGRENYVMTSNNKASDKLRDFGYADVMMMGILYQTTFAHIQNWKHTIMAISASRFASEEFNKNVLLSNQHGLLTESHTDALDKYNLIIRNGIDFISTDLLMPENTGYGQIVSILDLDDNEMKELRTDGTVDGTQISLKSGNFLEIGLEQYRHFFLYGVTLEIEFSGECVCRVQGREYELSAPDKAYFRYPVLLHKEDFSLKIDATAACHMTGLRLTVTKF